MALTRGIFIVGAKRTAFGKFGGAFTNVSATDLQTVASKAVLKEAGVKPEQVDSVVVGNIHTLSSAYGIFLPRHVLLNCGIPLEKPALGVNRLCGSGFQSIVTAAHDILLGTAKVAMAGGTENMSQIPFVVRNVRFGTALGQPHAFEDSLWVALTDSYCNLSMALTAENLAVKFNIGRETVDEYAAKSQANWKRAHDEGRFNAELTPVQIKVKGKQVDFAVDEHPKPNTTIETLAKLKPVFKKDGVVTAGSASGICDGAAAVLLASESAATEYNLKPLARLVAYAVVGVPPEIMGFGPVPAIQKVLEISGLTIDDIDLIDINEAFAVQALACAQALKIDPSKFNSNGGAVAMGHPLGATGTRITGHLVHELKRRGLKRAIGSACIGGGQGIAVLVEAV